MIKNFLKILIPTMLLFGDTHEIPQFWNAYKVSGSLSENYTVSFENDFRTYNLGEEMHYFHGDIGISFSVFESYNLSVNFREVYELKSGVWQQEHRPHVTLSKKMNIGNLGFSGRTRIEYRLKQDKDGIIRSRDMVALKYNRSFTKFELVPYIADEIFFDFDKSELNRNRIYLGVEIKNFPVGKPVLYFMQQRDWNGNRWEGRNIIGIKLSL